MTLDATFHISFNFLFDKMMGFANCNTNKTIGIFVLKSKKEMTLLIPVFHLCPNSIPMNRQMSDVAKSKTDIKI